MIVIKNFRTLGSLSAYDEVWAIVRSLKNKSAGIRQVASLSPSWDLFGKYMDLKNRNAWNVEAFRSVYLPQFLSEMRSGEARDALNELYRLDTQGKTVALVCFCSDEALCHRSIIAGLLQGVHCDVQTETGADYSYYYDMWLTAPEPKPIAPARPSLRGERYYLSNMYPCHVTVDIDGQTYRFLCAESAYQAHRFPGHAAEFTQLDGYAAKRKAHSGGRADWHKINVGVMRKVLAAKFGQNPDLMTRLKAEPGVIEEINTWGDRFWGICGGQGENMLGKLLMELRDM